MQFCPLFASSPFNPSCKIPVMEPVFTSYSPQLEDMLAFLLMGKPSQGKYIAFHPQPGKTSLTESFSLRGWNGILVVNDEAEAEVWRAARAGDIVLVNPAEFPPHLLEESGPWLIHVEGTAGEAGILSFLAALPIAPQVLVWTNHPENPTAIGKLLSDAQHLTAAFQVGNTVLYKSALSTPARAEEFTLSPLESHDSAETTILQVRIRELEGAYRKEKQRADKLFHESWHYQNQLSIVLNSKAYKYVVPLRLFYHQVKNLFPSLRAASKNLLRPRGKTESNASRLEAHYIRLFTQGVKDA